MKKMLIIIAILFIIFVGMIIYRNAPNSEKNIVTINEINQIEEYISKIYMWKEVTKEALPKFDNINDVDELWLWEVVKKNLEEQEIIYSQIQEKSKEIFGDRLQKEFPKEGNEIFEYNQQEDLYVATSINLDNKKDTFLIDTIQKIENGYQVDIIEYIEDYSEEIIDEDISFNIIIKNTEDEEIRKNT